MTERIEVTMPPAEVTGTTLPRGWRHGYDSASGTAIPTALARGAVIMGYPDRQPDPWTPDDFARYKTAGAAVARITQHDPPDWASCSIADWEQGAIFDAASLRTFVVQRNRFRPGSATVYTDLDNLKGDARPPLARILHGLNWNAWLADWHPPAFPVPSVERVAELRALLPAHVGLVAVQYKPGGLFDTSVVIDPSWHPAPSMYPAAPPELT